LREYGSDMMSMPTAVQTNTQSTKWTKKIFARRQRRVIRRSLARSVSRLPARSSWLEKAEIRDATDVVVADVDVRRRAPASLRAVDAGDRADSKARRSSWRTSARRATSRASSCWAGNESSNASCADERRSV